MWRFYYIYLTLAWGPGAVMNLLAKPLGASSSKNKSNSQPTLSQLLQLRVVQTFSPCTCLTVPTQSVSAFHNIDNNRIIALFLVNVSIHHCPKNWIFFFKMKMCEIVYSHRSQRQQSPDRGWFGLKPVEDFVGFAAAIFSVHPRYWQPEVSHINTKLLWLEVCRQILHWQMCLSIVRSLKTIPWRRISTQIFLK